jgi:hypothetical protein
MRAGFVQGPAVRALERVVALQICHNRDIPMKALLIVLAACITPVAFANAANVFCVASSDNLTDALASLSTSAVDTDADEIRIRTGSYSAPVGGWVGSVTTHHALTIRGGFTDEGCTQQTLDASMTILDGNGTSGVLTINTPLMPNSDIEVSGLTFQNGMGNSAVESCAGGLKIGDPGPINNGKVLIERNIFRDNSAVSNGFSSHTVGGLLAATDGTSLTVRGNLFLNNSSPNEAAASLHSDHEIDVSNNTFVGNHSTDSMLQTRFALDFFTASGLMLSNNIFWGNRTGDGEFDINLSGQLIHATLVNNDIQAATGTAKSETQTMNVDPEFVGNGDFRLSVFSTLIDAGVDSPPGGLASVDLDGAPRIDATAADLGAYESSYILVSDFE